MSYQVVDAVGVASIAAIIKQSGLQKISIVKYGSAKGVLPVFEDNDSKTNDRIVKGFTDWANNILLGNQYNDTVYEVVLYNEPPEEEPDEDTGEKKTIKRGYYRANKMKFNFQLFRSGQPNQQQNERVSGHADPYTPEKLSELVNNEILKNELLRRLTAVENDVNELFDMIADIQENDVSGTEENKTNQYLDKLINLMNGKTGKSAQVNGTGNEPEKVKENINKAIKILYKHDKQIDVHLLKLANLAETNTLLFNQIVESLEKM